MEGNPEPRRLASEPDAVVDLERNELLMVLRDVQEDSGVRQVVDLDRKGLLTSLREVQEGPAPRRTASVEDEDFLWLG
jgi:hypothetical protein